MARIHARFLIALCVVAFASCATSITSTTLPAGYQHDGAKTIVVVPADPKAYGDLVACHQMEAALEEFALFDVQPRGSDAELRVVMTAGAYRRSRELQETTASEDSQDPGPWVTAGSVLRPGGTFVGAKFTTLGGDVIYRRALEHRKDFRASLVSALCHRILKFYAKGI